MLAPGRFSELPDASKRHWSKLVPDFLWISTEHTARVSLNALERNKDARRSGSDVKSDVGGQWRSRAIVA